MSLVVSLSASESLHVPSIVMAPFLQLTSCVYQALSSGFCRKLGFGQSNGFIVLSCFLFGKNVQDNFRFNLGTMSLQLSESCSSESLSGGACLSPLMCSKFRGLKVYHQPSPFSQVSSLLHSGGTHSAKTSVRGVSECIDGWGSVCAPSGGAAGQVPLTVGTSLPE